MYLKITDEFLLTLIFMLFYVQEDYVLFQGWEHTKRKYQVTLRPTSASL